MSAATETPSPPEQALHKLMCLVTARRTVFDFDVAEKVSYTHRVEATTWKEAAEKVDDYEGDIIDGSHQYLRSYRPTRQQKVKQVKIGYEWYDLSDILSDAEYYLESDVNVNHTFMRSLEVA